MNADITVNDRASDSLEDIGNAAQNATQRIQSLEAILEDLERQLQSSLDAEIDVNDESVIRARRDVEELLAEVQSARQQLNDSLVVNTQTNSGSSTTQTTNTNSNINVSTNIPQTQREVAQLREQLERLQSQLNNLGVDTNIDLGLDGLNESVNGLVTSLRAVESELRTIQSQVNSLNGSNINVGGSTSTSSSTGDIQIPQGSSGVDSGAQETINRLTAEIQDLQHSIELLTASNVANGVNMSNLGRNMRQNTYDMDRLHRQQMRMFQNMLRYAQRLNPKNVLNESAGRLSMGTTAFGMMPDAKTQLEMNALMGMSQSAVSSSRKKLSQLGFGRTKREIKALEAQMHSIANIRMDNLRDQIKLTEKALKEMSSAANAHEYAQEMEVAKQKLAEYKRALKDADPVKQIGRVNGYDVAKIFGKDVFIKPIKGQLNRVGAMVEGFFSQDMARMLDRAYKKIDGAATKIVGEQTTKAETKAKIMQLQTRYQMLGQTINQFVTPAVLGLAAAFGMVAANADKGFNKYQAQTLTSDPKTMNKYKDKMADTQVETGASYEEVAEVFSVLNNQLGKTEKNIQKAATMGLYFSKVWGVDAVDAVSTVDEITKELGVSEKQAQDILALALKKHQGDIKAATKDVMSHEKAWKKASSAGKEGADAYKKMVDGIDAGAIARFGKALRQMGAALLELWQQLEPTLTKIAEKITVVAKNMTEFLRNNPGMAKLVGHAIALGGAMTVLLGLMAPVAGFLIMHRNLFQGLAQAMGGAARGGTAVLNPAVRMVLDTLKMTQSAILGLPRVIGGAIPALASMLRALPASMVGWIVNFVKLNPLLTAFSAIAWVAYKNWDRVGPLLGEVWKQLKRIGKAIMDAFSGPSKEGMNGFSKALNLIAKITGDVLVIALKLLIPLLEMVAKMMEHGGGGAVAAGGMFLFFGSVLGRMIPGLGLFGGALRMVFSPFTAFMGLLRGAPGRLARFTSILSKIPAAFAMVGRGLTMLGPLLMNPWTWVILAVVGIVVLVVKNWDKIKKATVKAWNGITGWLKRHWKTLLTIASGPFGWLAIFIGKNWDKIWKTTKKVWNRISSWLKKHWKTILSFAMGPFGAIFRLVSKNWNKISSATRKVWNAIYKKLKSVWNSIVNWTKKKVEDMRKSISTKFNNIRKSISKTVSNIKKSVYNAFEYVRKWATKKVNDMKKAVSNAFHNIYKAIKDKMNNARKAVTNVFSRIGKAVNDFKNGFKKKINDAFDVVKNLGSKARKWGSDIIDGLIGGLKSAAGRVGDVVSDIGNGIKKTFTGLLGIHSPSRVFKGYGININEGFAIGIKDTIGLVTKASQAISDAIVQPDPIDATVNMNRNLGQTMAGGINPVSRVRPASGAVTNNNSSVNTNNTNNNGVSIENAKFEVKVDKLQSADDFIKMRKMLQNVASEDLFGMAVRKL